MSDSLDLRVAQTLTQCRQLFGLNLSTEKAEGAGDTSKSAIMFSILRRKKAHNILTLKRNIFLKKNNFILNHKITKKTPSVRPFGIY